jgi:hypothetical protein
MAASIFDRTSSTQTFSACCSSANSARNRAAILLMEHLSQRKRRLIGERNFAGCVGFRLAQPNLQILALSQLWVEFLRRGYAKTGNRLCITKRQGTI